MSDRDPPRLSENGESSAFLRDAIRESKSDLPDETRLAAIALKLGPIVGIAGGAAGAAGGGGGAAAAGGSAAAKASVAPAAAKIGGMTLGMKIAAAAAVTVAVGGTAVVAPRVIAPKPAVTIAATAMVSAPRQSSTTTPIDLSLPPASASAAPLPVPTAKATAIVPPNPDDEVRTLNRAQEALNANDPATALSLCNDDAIVFPHGTNAQEREVMAINALTKLGRMKEAKAREAKFEKDFPGSAATLRVRQLVGESQ